MNPFTTSGRPTAVQRRRADGLRCALTDRDRGSAEPLALAILAVPMIFLLGLIIIGGRLAIASNSLAGVAGNAARDASIARDPAQARQLATSSALASLQAQALRCQDGPTVTVDTSGFSAPAGVSAVVRVDVSCTVALSDIGLPGMPGSRTLRDHGVSALDEFRSST